MARPTRRDRLPVSCRSCGALFTPTRDWQRYCSAACRFQRWEADHPRRTVDRHAASPQSAPLDDRPSGYPEACEAGPPHYTTEGGLAQGAHDTTPVTEPRPRAPHPDAPTAAASTPPAIAADAALRTAPRRDQSGEDTPAAEGNE
jgi:hypothetical protein